MDVFVFDIVLYVFSRKSEFWGRIVHQSPLLSNMFDGSHTMSAEKHNSRGEGSISAEKHKFVLPKHKLFLLKHKLLLPKHKLFASEIQMLLSTYRLFLPNYRLFLPKHSTLESSKSP